MTFSIAAYDKNREAFGVAIASSSPAVAARCAYLRPRLGAVISQNITDPRLGPAALDLLEAGLTAQEVIKKLVMHTPDIDFRQIALVDSIGRTSAYSGAQCLGNYGAEHGEGVVAAGNLLHSLDVLSGMVDAFESLPDRPLEERLLSGLEFGLEVGGEAGPIHSSGLVVVEGDAPWHLTDLRVDWHDQPVFELRHLWALWEPQKYDYLERVLNPQLAPNYGVPGEVTHQRQTHSLRRRSDFC